MVMSLLLQLLLLQFILIILLLLFLFFSANDDTSVSLNSSGNTSQTITFGAVVTDNVSLSSVTISPNLNLISSIGNNYTWSKVYNASQYSLVPLMKHLHLLLEIIMVSQVVLQKLLPLLNPILLDPLFLLL